MIEVELFFFLNINLNFWNRSWSISFLVVCSFILGSCWFFDYRIILIEIYNFCFCFLKVFLGEGNFSLCVHFRMEKMKQKWGNFLFSLILINCSERRSTFCCCSNHSLIGLFFFFIIYNFCCDNIFIIYVNLIWVFVLFQFFWHIKFYQIGFFVISTQ